jgi:hypothetical protein
MGFGRDCLSQQIFGPCSERLSVDDFWSRLGFQIASLLAQTASKCKSRCGEEWRLDDRPLQEVFEFRPLRQRYVTTRRSKVLVQQANKRTPRSGGMRCQSNGVAQHILCLHAQAPRAEGRRDFHHLRGRAIGVGRSPNINCIHPCDSVVGLPRTPQLQAGTGYPQQQLGAMRRDGQQRSAGHIDRRARNCATTSPSDTRCPKPHDMAHPKMHVAPDSQRSPFAAFQNMTAALTFQTGGG